MGFLRAVQSGGLEAFAEHIANGGNTDNFLDLAVDHHRLAIDHARSGLVLDEYHRHRFADVGLGELQHLARTLAIQRHRDLRLATLAVKTGTRIDNLVARHNYAVLQQVILAVTVLVQFRTGRQLAVNGILHVVFDIDRPVLQGRRGADNAFCRHRVLNARQLDNDAPVTLLLNNRFGNAQFVNAITQRDNVLLQGQLADLPGLFLTDPHIKHKDLALVGISQFQVTEFVVDQLAASIAVFRGTEFDLQLFTLRTNTEVAYLVLAQQGAQVGTVTFQGLLQCSIHVHLHQEVHTAAQVQAKVHGLCIDCLKPGWR